MGTTLCSDIHQSFEAVPKLRFWGGRQSLSSFLKLAENPDLAGFSKSLFQKQPGFEKESSYIVIYSIYDPEANRKQQPTSPLARGRGLNLTYK
jgi:hypothetical protein